MACFRVSHPGPIWNVNLSIFSLQLNSTSIHLEKKRNAFFQGSPISIQNVGPTFGSPLSGPHFPPISLQASSLHHLVEERRHCHAASVNSLVAKWRRSADGLLWLSSLPSPPLPSPLLSSLQLSLCVSTWRHQGERWSQCPLHSSTRLTKSREGLSPPWPELSCGSCLSWTRCSWGKHPGSLGPLTDSHSCLDLASSQPVTRFTSQGQGLHEAPTQRLI